jgi:hypothetical protein
MKSTIKITLVIALFCSAAFADGGMTSGGKSCQAPCLVEGQTTTVIVKDTNQRSEDTELLVFVRNFLSRIFW